MKKIVGSILALLLTSSTGFADAIVTDRPDFTESNELVSTVQIESGYTLAHTNETEHVIGEILIRKGLQKNAELRIGLPSFINVDSEDSISGFSDASIGVKLKFNESTAWILGTTLPTGSKEFKDDALNPFLKWCVARDLSDRISFSSNLGVQGIGSGDERTTQGLASLALGVGVTEKTGTYYEYYVLSPIEKGGDTVSQFNLGATYLVSDNFQLDARVGKDLSQDGYFLGVGVAYRL